MRIELLKNAFDIQICIFAGDYHYNEIRKLEKMNNTKKKILPKTGYLYFDYLNKFKTKKIKEDYIMIVPSWNMMRKTF